MDKDFQHTMPAPLRGAVEKEEAIGASLPFLFRPRSGATRDAVC